MKRKNLWLFPISLFVFLILSGCRDSGANETDEFELVPLVPDEIELVPLRDVSTSWTMVGEIKYEDDFGVSNYSFRGDFTVDNQDQIQGNGTGLIAHEGPCYKLTRTYEFPIEGHYKPDDDGFVFYDLFNTEEDSEEDDGNTVIEVDNTFVSCTVGEGMGELFALLRPMILLGEADHGALANGYVPVPADPAASYTINFTGGSFEIHLLPSQNKVNITPSIMPP